MAALQCTYKINYISVIDLHGKEVGTVKKASKQGTFFQKLRRQYATEICDPTAISHPFAKREVRMS